MIVELVVLFRVQNLKQSRRRITPEILDYIEYAKAKGCNMTGPEDPDILRLNVLERV